MRKYTVNESASSPLETLQRKYRATHSVEVIYLRVFKRIHLQPLYKSMRSENEIMTTFTENSGTLLINISIK